MERWVYRNAMRAAGRLFQGAVEKDGYRRPKNEYRDQSESIYGAVAHPCRYVIL